MQAAGRRFALLSVMTIAAVAALSGAVAAAAGAATRYVAAGGVDVANQCLVQAAPCATIQHAVDEAVDGDVVRVGAGTYAESVTVDAAVTMIGPNAGIDPNTDSRGAEATIVTGGEGTSIIPQVPGIAIDGFTVSASDTGYPLYTGGTDIGGLVVSNNVLDGGVRALTVATSGDDLRIDHNRIDGKGYGVHFGTGAYADVAINRNVVSGPVDFYAIFINGNGTIDGFELKGNSVADTSNIAADIEEGVVSGNAFDVDAPGAMNLQINLHDSSLTNNTFDGNGTTGCLQLFGSQFGLVPSRNVVVSQNSFDDCNVYGIQLSPDVEAITIVGNTIVDAYDGINTRDLTPWDVTGRDIEISANRIVGSIHAGISNTVLGEIDARNNWWGCNAGPGAAGCGAAVGGVETSPHVVLSGEANSDEIVPGASIPVSAGLHRNSAGEPVAGIPDGAVATFAAKRGSFSLASVPLNAGTASSTFTAGSEGGPAGIEVEVDGEKADVPLTVVAPPAPQAPTPAPVAEGVVVPMIEVGNYRKRKVVPRGGSFVIAVVACPAQSCTIRAKTHRVKMDGKVYNVRARLRNRIGMGESTRVRIVLTRTARRALAVARKGWASVDLAVTTSAGFAETLFVGQKLKLRSRRAGAGGS